MSDKKEETNNPQIQADRDISNRIFKNFLTWRDNRNSTFSYFRNRTWLDYINDSNARFNNYKLKPAWKEPFQANISDTTTHAKLMAIVAQQVTNMYRVKYDSRFSKSIISQLLAQVLQDIYDFTESGSGNGTRNGELDTLFMTLKACREGTSIGFEGYRKDKYFEGIDARLVPIDEYFPSDMTKFHIHEDPRKIWRTVMSYDDFKMRYSTWYQQDKVKPRSQINTEEMNFFHISEDLEQDQVELLRQFDKVDDEFFITANGINITKPGDGTKLSSRRKDKEDGFWKIVFEAYDDQFFPGRSLPDLMQDAQDGIDELFNNMFDRENMATNKPILVGGINQTIDDYVKLGQFNRVNDVNQIKEMDIDGIDRGAVQVLKELQDRQHFISVDTPSSNVKTQTKTATEVERAQQAAEKLNSVFGVMIKDGLVQKARLRAGTNLQYTVKSLKFREFVRENVKLIKNGRTGTRTVRFSSSPKEQKSLEAEASLMQGGTELNEIFEMTPKKIENFEFKVSVQAPALVEKRLKAAKDAQFSQVAFNMPDVYDRTEVGKDFAEAFDKDWEKVKAKGEIPMGQGEGQVGGQSEQTPEMVPSLRSAIPQPVQ
uniref:Uncharacterized protein n=1 Tax=viral metagenome TaxID=1070528 RepID=A0A6H1ZLK8_9ZZZZ